MQVPENRKTLHERWLEGTAPRSVPASLPVTLPLLNDIIEVKEPRILSAVVDQMRDFKVHS